MKTIKQIITVTVYVAVAAILVWPAFSQAEEDQALDEILSGFEDAEYFEEVVEEVGEDFEEEEKTDEADEDLSDEEVLEGFEEDSKAPPPDVTETRYLPSNLNLDGYFKISSVYAVHSHEAAGTDTDWQGLTRLRPELKFDLDAKLPHSWKARFGAHAFFDFAYMINGRDNFENEVLDQYEKEIEIDEAWIDPLVRIYLEALDDPPEPTAFGERFRIVGAQRMIKALGSFGYLTVATRGGRYLDAIPRTVGRLRTLLPKSKETKDLFELLARSGLLNT